MPTQTEDALPHIAGRVNWLFDHVRKNDGSCYTMAEIETAATALGYVLSKTALWKIRRGHTVNPGYLTVQALAHVFQVPVTFFYKGLLTPAEEARVQFSLAAPTAQEIGLRTMDLEEEQRQALLGLINVMPKPR